MVTQREYTLRKDIHTQVWGPLFSVDTDETGLLSYRSASCSTLVSHRVIYPEASQKLC